MGEHFLSNFMENIPLWIGSKSLYLLSPFLLASCLCSGPVLLAVPSAFSPAVSFQTGPSSALSDHLPQLAVSHWKLPGRGLALCLFPAWEGEAGLEKTVQKCRKTTSSSLNKPALLHLFAQIFPLPMEKTFHLLPLLASLSWGWGSLAPLLHACCGLWASSESRSLLGGSCSGALTRGPWNHMLQLPCTISGTKVYFSPERTSFTITAGKKHPTSILCPDLWTWVFGYITFLSAGWCNNRGRHCEPPVPHLKSGRNDTKIPKKILSKM